MIFRQERIGLNGIPFTILKFRTMEIESERVSDIVVATKEDKRITQTGRLLRPMHLDELPQFINVLRGEMSLVGPRPCQVWEVSLRCEEIPGLSKRHEVRPGVTGPAQVRGRTLTQQGLEMSISLDLAYVNTRSLLGDISIIIKTIPVILQRKGI